MKAALSEHRFRGKDRLLLWKGLNDTAPATIFPLDVLIEMTKST